MSGTLFLIPTPIDDVGNLEKSAFDILIKASTIDLEKSIFAIEDLKPGRKRWLRWNLPREVIPSFILYNEHSAAVASEQLLIELKAGKNVYLMSDGGMPSFCDPGRELVKRCHQCHITVTSSPFYNSVILALALSGFDHRSFVFEGFLPRDRDERNNCLKSLYQQPKTIVLMDTPYRMLRLLDELKSLERSFKTRELFLATNLTTKEEKLFMGTAKQILAQLKEKDKREFVIIVESL